MTDKNEIKFAIRYLKEGLKSKRTPPLYEELMKELGFVTKDKALRLAKEIAELKDITVMQSDFAKQLDKARKIILKLYNAGRDVLMCQAEEKAYDNLSDAINDKSIEQFITEFEK